MRKHKYNQFSFPARGNEYALNLFLNAYRNGSKINYKTLRSGDLDNLVGIKIGIKDRPEQSYWGDFAVVRVFQWSNGNITVVGYLI